MCLRHCLSLIVVFCLAACNLQNLQLATPAPDPVNIIEVQKRANEAYEKEDWKTAETEYQYLTQQTKGEAEPWFRLGNIYARTDRLDAAVTAYREALVRDSKNSKTWHNLGIVQLRQATNTFIEMLQYTKDDDPLNKRAQYVVNTVSDLMASGFESSTTE